VEHPPGFCPGDNTRYLCALCGGGAHRYLVLSPGQDPASGSLEYANLSNGDSKVGLKGCSLMSMPTTKKHVLSGFKNYP